MIVTSERLGSAEFAAGTGWALEPEGACQGEMCVPLPAGSVTDGTVDLDAVAARLRMPLVRHDPTGAVAVGPAVLTGGALATARAPELELPDLDGRTFRLSSLRGQKVVLVAWAPY
jgi:hypothetical protein